MQAKITEEDEKFLKRMEKNYNRIFFNYMAVGMLVFLALFTLIGGILLKSKGGFLMAIFFGGLGLLLFITSRIFQRLCSIIKKLYDG